MRPLYTDFGSYIYNIPKRALGNDSQIAQIQNLSFTLKLADYAARQKGTSGLLLFAPNDTIIAESLGVHTGWGDQGPRETT